MAVDIFMKIDGVPGESTASGHEGEIDLSSFSFGVENPTTIGSATGGAGAGKASFKEFTITKHTDKSSTTFFKNCCSGTHYPNVVITLRKAGGESGSSGREFLVYKFETVFTTKIDWSGPGDEGPEEEISFVYGKIEITYTAPDNTTYDTVWDVGRNEGS
jgi:type VI secretion system secreted protein Hcp